MDVRGDVGPQLNDISDAIEQGAAGLVSSDSFYLVINDKGVITGCNALGALAIRQFGYAGVIGLLWRSTLPKIYPVLRELAPNSALSWYDYILVCNEKHDIETVVRVLRGDYYEPVDW